MPLGRPDRIVAPMPTSSSRQIVVHLALVLLAQACTGAGDSASIAVAGRTIELDSVAYAAMPRLELDSLGLLCPLARWRCPPEELLLGAVATDGDVALAARSGAVYRVAAAPPQIHQILFDRNNARPGVFGGTLESVGDSAWRLLLPDHLSYGTFSDAGRYIDAATGPLRLDYSGSAARDLHFVRLLLPSAKQIGDTVLAEVEAIAPPSVRGDIIARLLLPATHRSGSDMRPLPPFFTAQPVWGLTPDQRIFYSPATSYEILFVDGDEVTLRIAAGVPRHPVDAAELDAAAARFMATMPNYRKFREAAQSDVDRRRAASARFHPVITDIRLTPGGGLFVRGSVDPEEGTVRWDVFSSTFEPRGYFTLGDLDRLLLIQHDTLLIARPMPGGAQLVQWTRLRALR